MTGAGYGAIGGAVLGGVSSILSLKSANKQALGAIGQQGEALKLQGEHLVSNLKIIEMNRNELDRQLGDVLSDNALATAKSMATAKVIMSTRGTVGGTSAMVSKQAYIDQIQADAQSITKARSDDINMLTSMLQKQVYYKTQQRQAQWNMDSIRSQMQSPFGAALGTLGTMIGMGASGATLGQNVSPT